MRNKRAMGGPMASAGMVIALAFLAAAAAGCTTWGYRNNGKMLSLGRSGMTVLVDSSVRVATGGGPDFVSIPENAMIGVEMLKAVEEGFAGKGYVRGGPAFLSVGASYADEERVLVRTVAGILESPASMGKPFIVRPVPSDPAAGGKIQDLFRWARTGEGTVPKELLDIARTTGLALIGCAGGNRQALSPAEAESRSIGSFRPGAGPEADAWSEVTFVVLDRSAGRVVWRERGTLSAFTPEAAAMGVAQLIGELPAAP